MIVASLSFKIMEYFGIWRPLSWKSNWAIRFYNIYNFFILFLVYSFTLTNFISLFYNTHDIDVFTDNLFIFSTMIVLSFKMTYVSWRQEEIVAFINMFLDGKCIPRNDDEKTIWEKNMDDQRALLKGKNVTLPFRSWLPFKVESRSVFWATYAYQLLTTYIVSATFASIEVLASIMMQQMCTQLELIAHRLLELPKLRERNDLKNVCQQEGTALNNCILHHVHLFSIEKELNKIFGFMVAVQFLLSTINLCTSGFQITKLSPTNLRFWSLTSILSCYIFQTFIYCWCGEQMIQKSISLADEVYKMDWHTLSEQTKTKLIIIMIRANKPIQLTGASLVTMSTESLMKILKISYSVFNLLNNSN